MGAGQMNSNWRSKILNPLKGEKWYDFFLMKDELEENLKISSTQNYEKVSFNIALISNLINYDYFSKSIIR